MALDCTHAPTRAAVARCSTGEFTTRRHSSEGPIIIKTSFILRNLEI